MKIISVPSTERSSWELSTRGVVSYLVSEMVYRVQQSPVHNPESFDGERGRKEILDRMGIPSPTKIYVVRSADRTKATKGIASMPL